MRRLIGIRLLGVVRYIRDVDRYISLIRFCYSSVAFFFVTSTGRTVQQMLKVHGSNDADLNQRGAFWGLKDVRNFSREISSPKFPVGVQKWKSKKSDKF
jgi:hypothetical protein